MASVLTSIISAGVSSNSEIAWTSAEKRSVNVAAERDNNGGYAAAAAAPFPPGTPVDVVLDDVPKHNGF